MSRRPRRRGITIFEVLIAIAITSILTIVLFRVLISAQKNQIRTLDTLSYLRDASLLMEYVKKDIRAASRESPRETIAGSSPRILTYSPDGVELDIQYRYDAEARTVTRRGAQGSREIEFGTGKGSAGGHITHFEVKPVEGEGNEAFFQVVVEFASPRRVAEEEAGRRDPKNRPRSHRVQALVNRRTPAGTDDKWKAAFR